MKRALSISIIVFTSIIMLLLSAIPHHHHSDGATCFHTEYHHSENHKQESDNHGKAADNSHCVAHSLFFADNTDLGSRLKEVYDIKYDEVSFLSDLTLYVSFELNHHLPCDKPDFGEYVFSYHTTETPAPHGLRAPPLL